jgi:uncharacterized protein (TIGR02679 family)
VTLRDLRRIDTFVAEGTLGWICENPRVLEAAMDAGARAVMVCTMGNPTVVVTSLLERIAEQGARLRYRGDFDWPGLAMANRIITTYRATPWRMGCDDYEAALAEARALLTELPALEGAAVEAAWDSHLTTSMSRHGRAVHEELILETLVGDLA